MHKDVICHHSDYFRGVFEGRFAESGSGTLKLPEEDPIIFRTYVDWLYCQDVIWPSFELRATTEQYLGVRPLSADGSPTALATIEDVIDEEDEDSDESEEDPYDAMNPEEEQDKNQSNALEPNPGVFSSLASTIAQAVNESQEDDSATETNAARFHQRHMDLLDLYILADRRDTQMLRNAVLDKVVASRQKRWPYMSANHDLVNKAYAWLPARSKLCDYLAEEAAFCWSKENRCIDILRGPSMELHHVFLSRVAWVLFRLSAGDGSPRPRWCAGVCRHFHEHNGDEAEKTQCRIKLAAWQGTLWDLDYDSQSCPSLDWS